MKEWETFLAKLKEDYGEEVFQKWLHPLMVERFDARNLYLKAEDPFQAKWFEEHIRPRLKRELVNRNHYPIAVHLLFKKTTKPNPPPKKETPLYPFDTLDPQCILEETHFADPFVKALFDACQKGHPLVDNPLFLYGIPGTGKTHLQMALAHLFQEQGKTVAYVRSATFMQHYINAIRSGDLHPFRNAYRNVDALFIDDIHLLADKAATQEEFFHTFNTLHTENIPIVLTAPAPPSELTAIAPRLTSRFEWGLTLKLSPFTKEDLKQLLKIKQHLLSLTLAKEVPSYLLTHFGSSASALTRALEALALRTTDQAGPLSLPAAEHLLTDLRTEVTLSPDDLLFAVSREFSLPIKEILSANRSRECTLPRQIAMWLCRHTLNLPYKQIGALFSRDHSTVITSIRTIANNPSLQQRLVRIESKLNQKNSRDF